MCRTLAKTLYNINTTIFGIFAKMFSSTQKQLYTDAL